MPRSLTLAVVFALLAIAVPLAGSASAQGGAGTIVFIRDDQVWVATPDGSQEQQVTSGGSWEAPSMDDNGVIVAVRDDFTLVRMAQDGTVLTEFDPDAQHSAGIVSTAVSPDGSLIAYGSIGTCPPPASPGIRCDVGAIVAADGSSTEPLASSGTLDLPTWLSNGQAAFKFSGDVVVTLEPGGEPQDWFENGWDIDGMAASRDGRFLAISSIGDYDVNFYALEGPPPTPPTLLGCGITLEGSSYAKQLGYAPTSDGVVFEQAGDVEAGVQVFLGVDPVGCSAAVGGFFAGASQPAWGAADFGVTDAEGGGTGGGTGGGGSLPDGVERIDGGGSSDPIGQAVTLSQALFDDGAATRVVLATADRFPDALAGSALAGPFGPILFTSGTGDLDPRTAQEIARVTGGNAPVLVLGGTAAISDQAAASARAAGGDVPCATPLPSSCRFAGSGREETATLIADAVAAENPANAGFAMVARSDDFADAITGGGFAAVTGIPILLTPTNLAHGVTIDWLERHPTDQLIVLGGQAAISDGTANALPAAEWIRVSGGDRTATSAAIATQLWGQIGAAPSAVALVNVRAPNGWQTALSAAVASALFNMPQLGVENPPTGLSQPVAGYLGGVAAGTPLFGFGDPSLVSNDQLAEAVAAFG